MTEVVRASETLAGLRGVIELAHMPDSQMLTRHLRRAAELLSRMSDIEGDKE